MIGQLLFGVGTTVVYRNARVLQGLHPAERAFHKRWGSVDAVWLSGVGNLRRLEKGRHGIKRLILPHPASRELVRIAEASDQEYDFPGTIVRMTSRARQLVSCHACSVVV